MSMPIQRQSEQYSAFDSGPRWERDRASHDLPKGLAGLLNSTGPRITGGLLNTRTAVNVDGMDPDSHAYHTELPPGRGGEITWVDDAENYGRNPRREWNPDFGYEPTDEDERRQEGVAEDDESGYNWGPEPHHASRHPFDRTAACETCGVDVYHMSGTGWVHADDDDKDGEEYDEDHQAEPDHDDSLGLGLSSMNAEHERRELQGKRTEPDTEEWENGRKAEHHDPRWHQYEPDMEREGRRTAAEMAPAPIQIPQGGGYQIGHRIGMDYHEKVIPGTVIGLDGPSVKVRWDDKQYSIEEPRNIRLL